MNPLSVKRLVPVILFAAIGLYLGGCLELIRRPATATGSAPSWEQPGNQPPLADVKQDTVPVAPADHPAAEKPQIDAEQPVQKTAKLEEFPVSNRDIKRNSRQQESVRQVNEYALWCVENSMWKEARLHLEQALERDSLAASIYNNLGIVYERHGEVEKAASSYRKARSLKPEKKAYLFNLQRLEERQEKAQEGRASKPADSLQTEQDASLFELESIRESSGHIPTTLHTGE